MRLIALVGSRPAWLRSRPPASTKDTRYPSGPKGLRTSAFVRGGLVCYEATLQNIFALGRKKKKHMFPIAHLCTGAFWEQLRENMRQARRSVLVALFVLVVVALCSNSVSASPVTRKLDCS